MSRYQIPKNAGPFYIIITKAGTPAVWNKKRGKAALLIPCKNEKQANEVLHKLEQVPNGGEIWV